MTLLRTAAQGIAVLTIATGLVAAAPRAEGLVVVGVLENPPFSSGCDFDRGDTIAVRPLFAKTAGTWVALDDSAGFHDLVRGPMSWTVAFDGRNIGTIRTSQPRAIFDADNGWSPRYDMELTLAPGEQAPHRITPGVGFSGWCTAPKRPLATVSQPNFADPDGWKPFRVTAEDREAAMPVFRAGVGKVYSCADTSTTPAELHYSAQDVEIVRGYRNRHGQRIVALEYARSLDACTRNDGPQDEVQDTQWVQLGVTSGFLGTGLQLVDAGDYDADGTSELLFAYSGYNADGYMLFAGDDLRTRVEVRWGYH